MGSNQTAQSSREGMTNRLNEATQSAPLQDIIGKILGVMTPGGPISKTGELVSKGVSEIPKIGKYIAPTLSGAISGGQYEAMQPNSTPESIAKTAEYGGAVGTAIPALSAGVKAIANKFGDITLGKLNVGKFVNDNFGPTSSIESLAAKNKAMYVNTEKQLQDTLIKYDNNTIKVTPDVLPSKVVYDTAKEAAADRASPDLVDSLNYIGDKIENGTPVTPFELNVVKRSLYTDAYSSAGKMKGSEYAKNTAKIASKVRQMIEDATDGSGPIPSPPGTRMQVVDIKGRDYYPNGQTVEGIAPQSNTIVRDLNQLEANHMALTAAIRKVTKKNPSNWGYLTKAAPIASLFGGATAAGSPLLGTALAAGTLAGETVPGFTAIGKASKGLQNPDIMRILSVLLPQYLK